MGELLGLRAFYARDRVARVACTVLLLSKPVAIGLGIVRMARLESVTSADPWFMKILLSKHLVLLASVCGLVLLVTTIARELDAADPRGRSRDPLAGV